MNTKKPLMVAGLIAALSMGSIGVAVASTHSAHKVSSSTPSVVQVDPAAAVLAKLVTAGTITQAQSTVILAALEAARPPMGHGGDGDAPMGHGPMGHGPKGFNLGKNIVVVTSTLGITAAQLQTDLAAGKSLATIAGTKTAALITALVAAETTEINARVTSGKITQALATTLIAGLQALVTTVVNATPPVGGMEHGKHGHGFGGGMGGGMGTPSVSPGPAGNN